MKNFLFIFGFAVVAASALPGSAEAATLSRPQNSLGLVGYWSFNEGVGTNLGDFSGNRNDGTLVNTPTWVTGKFSKALSFVAASSQYVTVPDSSSLQVNTDMTVSAWVNFSSLGTDRVIIGQYDYPNSDRSWALYYQNSGAKITFKTSQDGSVAAEKSFSFSTINQWVHITVVYSGGTATLYLNGASQGSGAVSASLKDSAGPILIGASGNNTTRVAYMNGSIDDVRLYNRALTAGEIAALYNQTSSTKIGMRLTSGLSGAYYDGTNFNTYVATYIDSTINFNPADTALGVNRANGGDTFSVKWTGYIKPDYTGTYTFYTTSDDGARLYVNGSTVIDSWIDQGPTEHSGTMALTAGQWYPIELDFYENGGGAAIMLSWSEASVSKQIIPAANLKPGTNDVKLNTSSATLQSNGLANGLVGFWTFDGKDTVWTSSTAGTATDRSGNGNTGTLTNMTQAGSVVIGKMGQALMFGGANKYVSLGDSNAFTPSGDFSVSLWMKPVTGGGNFFWGGVSKAGAGGNREWEIGFDPTQSDAVRFLVGNSGGSWSLDMIRNTGLARGVWHHVVGVVSGGTGYVYIDGDQSGATASYAGSVKNTTSPVYIGNVYSYESQSYFNGALDDVRFYNRALSAREVKQLYDIGK